jgi:hypothetical protein
VSLSAALRYPVASPWKLERQGQATAYLSARQAALLIFLQRRRALRRQWTLAELCRWTGIPSRGQAWHELRRLRQLDLIAYTKPRRGARGYHRFWIPRKRWALALALRGRRLRRDNDSLSTPSGFVSRIGVEQAERNRAAPPGSRGPAALTGPRRGRPPPRVLYARCPAGHTVRPQRTSWRRGASSFHGEWQGFCGRCRQPIRETIDLVVELEARPLSAEELADPELRERRRRAALEALADPATPYAVREQLRRDYLAPPAPATDRRPGNLEPAIRRLNRRSTPRGDRNGGSE